MIFRASKSSVASARPSAGLWQVYATAAIVCLGVSAAAYFVGVQPALATRDADQAYAADLQSRRQSADDLLTAFTATRQELDQTKHQVEGMPLRLEPASTINQRLAKLTDLAVGSGLQINEMQPGALMDSAPYRIVPIRISGTGTYPACALFLHQLRQRFPDTAARSVEAANPSPTREHTAGSFHFELSWYTAPLSAGGTD